MDKIIFFDNASTTKCELSAMDIVMDYNINQYYNPSAPYTQSVKILKDITKARAKLIKLLGSVDGSLVFTSGGTESDNMALLGCKKRNMSRIIISAVEHSAIFVTAMELKQRGYDVVICKTNQVGQVEPEELESLLSENTSLVSIMHINNETGCINNISKLVEVTKSYNKNILFHSDGVQAFGKLHCNVDQLGVDFYSISGHKIGAPKGIGALFVKKGVYISPIIFGGGQESGLRSGTDNVSGILSFAHVAEIAYIDREKYLQNCSILKNYITNKLSENQEIKIISDDKCTPNIVLISTAKVRGEVMVHSLAQKNIIIGTGSACSTHSKGILRLPNAIKLEQKYYNGIIRISFSKYNTIEEAEIFIKEFLSFYKELSQYARD